MSTLVAQTISNGTVSTSSANVIQGSAKAWVNFNGTTGPGTIRAQYNVSSVTRNSTGNYTVNFTNAMPDTNYAIIASSTSSGVSEKWTAFCTSSSASSGTVLIVDPGVSFYNSTTVCVAIFR
jgi:hypothetical protein